jgi:hypothetical protein
METKRWQLGDHVVPFFVDEHPIVRNRRAGLRARLSAA